MVTAINPGGTLPPTTLNDAARPPDSLLNHTTTKKQLSIELSRMRRENMSLAFALINLDHFKSVNDTYEHPIGAQVLKTMSNMLKQRLHDGLIGDMAARSLPWPCRTPRQAMPCWF